VTRFRPGRLPPRETLRLLPIVVPVATGGAAALAWAAARLSSQPPALRVVVATTVLAVAAALAEGLPVRVATFPAGTISISTIFIISVALLAHAPETVVAAFAARASVELVLRRPLIKLAFNSGLYAASGLVAGIGASAGSGVGGAVGLALAAGAATSAFFVLNVPLVVAVVSRASHEAFLPMLREWVTQTAVSFAAMGSVALILAVLWQRSPALTLALSGPLVVTALHQRSIRRELAAVRLALTDPLTGLGNHRHFHDALLRELERAADRRGVVSLCLFDLDDFKRINDTHGHLVGDDTLRAVATALRGGTEAFRLGGDEFALVLAGSDTGAATAIVENVLERVSHVELRGEAITFSAGLATFPRHAQELTELLRVADVALYVAKRDGKNRLQVAEPPAPAIEAVG
jgi:diguanylate cyclase (GGDEF)-like protein